LILAALFSKNTRRREFQAAGTELQGNASLLARGWKPYKDNWFDEASHVQPRYPHCTARFRFTLNGFIVSAQDGDSSAENMIGRLHLNHSELVKDREDVLMMLDGDKLDTTDFFSEGDETAQSYAHIAFQRVGLSIPRFMRSGYDNDHAHVRTVLDIMSYAVMNARACLVGRKSRLEKLCGESL
jgi:hypothetical protein